MGSIARMGPKPPSSCWYMSRSSPPTHRSKSCFKIWKVWTPPLTMQKYVIRKCLLLLTMYSNLCYNNCLKASFTLVQNFNEVIKFQREVQLTSHHVIWLHIEFITFWQEVTFCKCNLISSGADCRLHHFSIQDFTSWYKLNTKFSWFHL